MPKSKEPEYKVTIPIDGIKLECESFNVGKVEFFKINPLAERRKYMVPAEILKTGSKSEINEVYSFLRFNTATQTTVEANDCDTALMIAREKIGIILWGLCFNGYGPAGMIYEENIIQSETKLIIKSHSETGKWKEEIFSGNTTINNKEISTIEEAIKQQGFLSLVECTNPEKKVLKERIVRALEWYRKVAYSDEPLDMFLFLWFGIEQLIPKYKTFSLFNLFRRNTKQQKKQNILKRFKRSIFKVCKNIEWETMKIRFSKNKRRFKLEGMQKQKIRFSEIKKMYKLRNNIVHEGYLLDYDEEKVKHDYLPKLVKVFKETILKTLELFPSCDNLEEIYQKV